MIRPADEISAGVRYFEIDCRHGTTKAFTDGPPAFSDSVLVTYLLGVHDDRERCACTAELRDRYGLHVKRADPDESSRCTKADYRQPSRIDT